MINKSEFQIEIALVGYLVLTACRLTAGKIEKPLFMGFSICVYKISGTYPVNTIQLYTHTK